MQNWEYKKLCDVCKTGSGGTPLKGHKEYYDNGNIPWLRSGEVCQKDITKSELYITEVGMNNSSAKLFPINTVLVAMYGATAGQVGILRFESTTNQAVCGIFPNEKTIPEFIYYYFTFYKDKLVAQAVGGAQPNISQIKIANTIIPLPPLEEQKRIVKILDEKFAMLETVKANAKANLQNAKDLFQSQLTNAFSNTTWEKKRLGDCGSFKNGMNFASTDTGYTIRSLGVGDFKNLYQIDDTEQLSEISLKAAPSEDYLLKDGDIVFVRSNGNKELVGRCLLVYPKNIPTTYSGFCIRFRKDYDELDADFLLHYMKAESSRKILNGKEGANISNLNQKILGDFEVPIPPLSEQKRIVEQLDSLSKKVRSLEEIYTKQLANCDELKQAFLTKAFNGEL